MPEYALFFVGVEAQRQRCTRAPLFARDSQRGRAKIRLYFSKASFALATAIFPFNDSRRTRAAGSDTDGSLISIRLSVSVSIRETKNEATECTECKLPPCLASSSRPERYASATAAYRSTEKIN